MEGGISVGDLCEPLAHHGFNGIESETIAAIKQWIKKGPAAGDPFNASSEAKQ